MQSLPSHHICKTTNACMMAFKFMRCEGAFALDQAGRLRVLSAMSERIANLTAPACPFRDNMILQDPLVLCQQHSRVVAGRF